MAFLAPCGQELQAVAQQEAQVVPEGAAFASPPHPFVSDPSGGFSRTIFQTDENPDFKIIIRDFSFPPDQQKHTVTLPAGAFLHILGKGAEISIANQRQALTAGARTPVPAGAPIDVVNKGEQHVIIRAVIVEAK